ncbi:MAG: Bug family tripartite tricarboxylate transporter substrate binding protein [Rhodoferax sp.]
MVLNRRHVLQASAASMLPAVIDATAQAQDAYPSKPVKVVVALPAGGVADVSVRILTEALSPLLNQPIVVDNKPGGIFQIGIQQAAQAAPDGYTLIHIINSMLAAQAAQKRYDMMKQLTPVCLFGSTDGALVCSNAAPFKTPQEMIAWAKANPEKLNYGTTGPGALEHLYMAAFAKKFGFIATHVPFKGGPDVMTALAQNEIQVAAVAFPLALQFGQRVRPMAMLVEKRNPLLPTLPTLKELGVDFNTMQYWGALAAPAGTPKSIIDTLQRNIATVVASPALAAKYSAVGLNPLINTPEQMSRMMADDLKFFTGAVVDADLKVN